MLYIWNVNEYNGIYSIGEPERLKDLVKMLQKQNDFTIPVTTDDWDSTPRCSMDVRRAFVVNDALREAKKERKI